MRAPDIFSLRTEPSVITLGWEARRSWRRRMYILCGSTRRVLTILFHTTVKKASLESHSLMIVGINLNERRGPELGHSIWM